MAAGARELFQFHGVDALQNLHPLVVHYPVALLTLSPLLYVLGWLAKRDSLAWIALSMLALGTLGAAVAVWTGLGAGEGVMVAPSVREHILIHHKQVMIAVFTMSVVLTAWAAYARPLPQRGRLGFIALMLTMAVLTATGADYGAWMVYGYNAGGSLPQPIEFSH
ncbi:MAG TPA: DUF2231 domain-containing protein [Candidatus Binataceae bacterium]|nr:DUF2231 domain-containing protein [Candidatus Binataceae bacterium]